MRTPHHSPRPAPVDSRHPGPGQRRLAALLLLCSLLDCTILGVGRKRNHSRRDTVAQQEAQAEVEPDQRTRVKAKGKKKASETDESGVRSITRLMRQFNDALRKKSFTAAGTLLSQAQRQIRKASAVTSSHPDFEDVQLQVQKASHELDTAIEVDRIARRNTAIADLIRRGDSALTAATKLYSALLKQPSTIEDLDKLDGAIALFRALRGDGADFSDDAAYSGHAIERQKKAEILNQLRTKVQWQVDVGDSVNALIEAGYHSGVDAMNQKDGETQVKSLVKSKVSFKACATAITDLQAHKNYNPSTPLRTRLGVLSLAKTRQKCLSLSKRADGRVGYLTWSATIERMVLPLNAAWSQMKSPKDPQAHYDLAVKATEALAKCLLVLDRTEAKPGFAAKLRFETLLGRHGAVQLRQACRRQRTVLVQDLPRLKWLISVENLRNGLNRLYQLLKRAEAEDNIASQAVLWDKAVAGLKECRAKCTALKKRKGADRAAKFKTTFGEVSVADAEEICKRRQVTATDALAKALKGKEVEEFASSTRGQEKDVVRREGIPSRIEAFRGGRIFIYESAGKRKELRRFGFDSAGRRVDYWVKWRNDMVHLLSELSMAMKAIREAKDSGAMLKATKAAAPVFAVCLESSRTLRKSPGYDATAVFTTPFGRLPPKKIGPSCAKEKARLRGTESALAWQARVEAVGDRLAAAQAALKQGKTSAQLQDRLALFGAAVGGLSECIERAAAMAKERRANTTFKVRTSGGKLTVQGLKSFCADQKGKADKALGQALKEKRLQNFVRGCKGDEVEVAKRQGMPRKVEPMSGGRVFVYGTGKAGKRFAFNKQGKRVAESVLKGQ